jgi:hypothetical protein
MNAKSIKAFCKSHKTANEKMANLYERFSDIHKGKCTREDFELGLLSIGSKVARVAGERCLRYPKDQYDKFIREQEFVSQEFWTYVHSIGENNNVTPSIIEKTIEPVIPEKAPEALSEPDPSEMESKCYEGLLPGNWTVMTLPQRIDFTKKVHHKGFRAYILLKDKDLKNYFSKVKQQPVGMPIYVTLFSFPSDNYSVEAKNLLKLFIGVLNDVGRARLQYVEYNEPKTVEIREVRN